MAKIFIRDYEDDFWGMLNVIGMGNNHSSNILPVIDQAIENKDPEITVYLNSCGGSVWCSLAIKNALQRAKEAGAKIITINEGICASAATQIFMEGDERIAYTSLFMIHKPSIFVWGNMTDEEMKREAEALKVCQDTILLTYAATGLDEATLNAMLNAETWLTPALCKSLGFATEDRSAPDKKADVLESSVNAIKSPENKVYASKFFNTIPLKNNNMNVQETLKQNTDAMEKSTSVLNQVLEFFNIKKPKNDDAPESPTNESAELASGGNIYFTGTLAVGTEVFSDEEMTTHVASGDHDLADGNFITVDDAGIVTVMDKKAEPVEDTAALNAELETLRSENASLQAALNASNTKLTEQNDALTKIKNIKSSFKPDTRDQEIVEGGNKAGKQTNTDGKLDLSKEAREARRVERESIANSKNKK
jgi:ATP-dependent protease ClpP protease subunit